MCGIAGVITNNRISLEIKENFEKILENIKHRGETFKEIGTLDDKCYLGTNRLPIVDREFGKQPFFSPDKNIMVVFNGEIYEYKKLKKKLEDTGSFFKTDCDTEVILNGYIYGGIEWLIENIKGMFAILIYDKKNKRLIAIRDHFGIKPLYWTKHKDCVYFSSEIKGLVHLKTEINEVKPGSIIEFTSFNEKIIIYFDIYKLKVNNSITFHEAKIKIKKLIENAVRRRVETDLPVAVLLGGIDSGIILGIAKKYNKNITAFTIGKDENAEDIRFAKMICNDFNVKLKIIYVSDQELINLIPKVVKTIETFEPNHIRGGTLSYYISNEIRKNGFKVALCGEGADELFCGYPEFYEYFKKFKYNSLNNLRLKFVSELCKTQLKRVDRTSMAFTVEVRVPYLDYDVGVFSLSLPVSYLIKGRNKSKYILREAFKHEFSEYLINQRKRVLTDGAGFGSNAQEGIFYYHALNQISDKEFLYYKKKYPELCFLNKEEVYYFKIFNKYYSIDKCVFLKNRPLVNRIK